MPSVLTLVIVLPIFIAVVVLFGALSLVGLIDPSDPALGLLGAASTRRFVHRPARRRHAYLPPVGRLAARR